MTNHRQMTLLRSPTASAPTSIESTLIRHQSANAVRIMTRVRALFAIERRGYNRQQFTRGREEARQEAALWEAKYRDFVDKDGLWLSKDLLVMLLQKTKEEVRVLRARLHECSLSKSCNSEDNNHLTMERLARENEALRGAFTALSSPSTL